MTESACPICSRPGGRPFGVVAELATSWVSVEEEGPLPGYVFVVSKRHVREPFQLPAGERHRFFEDCMAVAQALHDLLSPSKLNYEIHGNTIPHLHMHLYPRFAGDPYEGRCIDHHAVFHRSHGEVERIAAAVREVALGSAWR